MRLKNWKLWTAVIPLTIGLVLFFLLGGLDAVHSKLSPAPDKTADNGPQAPKDPTHEKIALEEQLQKSPNHVPILIRLAELARDGGQPKEAAEYLKKAVAADSSNLDARLELSRTLYEINDVDGALAQTKQVLADHPGQVDALYNIGAIYANVGQTELARQYWTRAAAADPKSDSGRKSAEALAKIGK